RWRLISVALDKAPTRGDAQAVQRRGEAAPPRGVQAGKNPAPILQPRGAAVERNIAAQQTNMAEGKPPAPSAARRPPPPPAWAPPIPPGWVRSQQWRMTRITVAMSTPAPCAASYTRSCASGRHSLSTTLVQSATVCGASAGAV